MHPTQLVAEQEEQLVLDEARSALLFDANELGHGCQVGLAASAMGICRRRTHSTARSCRLGRMASSPAMPAPTTGVQCLASSRCAGSGRASPSWPPNRGTYQALPRLSRE